MPRLIRRILTFLPIIAAVLMVFGTGGGGDRTVYAQQRSKPPSKVAAIVQDRVDKIRAARLAGPAAAARIGALSTRTLAVADDGSLEVEVHGASSVGSAEADALRALGATIVSSTGDIQWPAGVTPPPDMGMIVARIPSDAIDAAAALSWVVVIAPAERLAPDSGAFTSEGVVLHKTAQANSLGFTGAGVTVGVISDGVSNLADAQALGDLPPTVNVLNAGSGNEGTAMLEIVHDLAPGAALAFHGTGGGVASHVTALNALAAAGARVITEDIPFDAEPAFQKGAATTAAESLAAGGFSIHSSAGNLGATHSARVPAISTGTGPDGVTSGFVGCPFSPTQAVNIATGNTFDVSVGGGGTISATLQWSEPRAIFPTPGRGGFTDLDLFIMDSTATTCLATATNGQGGGIGDTIEQASWTNPGAPNTAATVKLVVNVFGTSSAVAPPTIDLRWRGGSALDSPTRAGSLNPDSNYTFGATSAAAANASNPATNNPANIPIEGFSAGGPVQLFSTTICPNGAAGGCTGVAGAPGTTTGGPTWTAADGVSVSGVGNFGSGNCPAISPGDCRFFGTSAATPHAAGVAALVLESLGGAATPFQINDAMAQTATDRGTPGFDNVWGWGVLNALAAVGEEADLEVLKDCKPDDPVDAGVSAVCTIFVDNHGPSVARNVKLTDTLTANGTFTIGTVTPSQGTCAPPAAGVVTCMLGDLPMAEPGVPGRATITVQVSALDTRNINDVATAVSDTFDPDTSNNTASDSVTVRASADLSLTKSDAPDPVLAGANLTYTLGVNNLGPSPAAAVIVSDFLPSHVTFVSAAGTGGASCTAGVPGDPSRPTECNFGTLASGAARTMTVVVTVNQDAGPALTNDASLRSDTHDPNDSNNVASATTTVNKAADLVINKTDSPDPVLAGRLLTYSLKVWNAGPSKATAVVVEDLLPDQVDFLSATFSNGTGTCVVLDVNPAPPTKKVSCQLGDMSPNVASPVFIFVNTTVKSNVPDSTLISNTGTIASSTPDPTPANNSQTIQTTVLNRADLVTLKTSDADVYKASATVIYTIQVTNNGPSDALNVIVVDNLPDVKQAIYVFDTGGCTLAANTLTCNLGTIAAGASKSFNVHETVKGKKGAIDNKATAFTTTFDPNTVNNVSIRTVLIGGAVK